MDFNTIDVRIDNIGNGNKFLLKLTHLPTGISVHDIGNGRLKWQQELMADLKKKVEDKYGI